MSAFELRWLDGNGSALGISKPSLFPIDIAPSSGTASSLLDDAALSGSGGVITSPAPPATGDAVITLGDLAAVAIGTVVPFSIVVGTSAISLDAATLAATGNVAPIGSATGSVTVNLDDTILLSSGSVTSPVTTEIVFNPNDPSPTIITPILGVPAGITPTFTPNDGRIVVTGNDVIGWSLVIGQQPTLTGDVIAGTLIVAGEPNTPLTIRATSPSVTNLTTDVTFNPNDPVGTPITAISSVPANVTPVFTPNDGRVAVSGNNVIGWSLVIGAQPTANSAIINGTIIITGEPDTPITIRAIVPV